MIDSNASDEYAEAARAAASAHGAISPALAAYMNQVGRRAADYLRTLPEASNIARLARQAAERHEQAQWSALAQGVEQVKAREERLAQERRALIERSTSTLRAALDDYNQQQTARINSYASQFAGLQQQARRLITLLETTDPDTKVLVDALQNAPAEEVEAQTQVILTDPKLRQAAEEVADQVLQDLADDEVLEGIRHQEPATGESSASAWPIYLALVILNTVPFLLGGAVAKNPDLNDPANTAAQWLGPTLAITILVLERMKNDRR